MLARRLLPACEWLLCDRQPVPALCVRLLSDLAKWDAAWCACEAHAHELQHLLLEAAAALPDAAQATADEAQRDLARDPELYRLLKVLCCAESASFRDALLSAGGAETAAQALTAAAERRLPVDALAAAADWAASLLATRGAEGDAAERRRRTHEYIL